MKKIFIVYLLASITGCTTQYRCFKEIEIYNSCKSPVTIKIKNYSNLGEGTNKSFVLEPGEASRVGTFLSINCDDLDSSLLYDYQLIIETKGNKKIIGRETIVSKSIKNNKKTTKNNHSWQLDTNEFCQ